MFVALLDLLTGHRQAFLYDGEPDALHHERSNEDTPVVGHPADIFRHLLVFCLIHCDHALDHRKVPAHPGKVHAQIALRRVPPRGLHAFFSCPRRKADHAVEWEAVLLEFLHRNGWGIAKEMPHDPIGSHATRDVEHLRSHLDPGRWHSKVAALIALQLADAIKDGQGLPPSRVIVEEIGNLRALFRASRVLQVLHRRADLRPVRGSYREDIGITCTVSGIGSTEPRGQPWDFVFHMTWRQGIDNRCAVIEHGDGSVALQTFVGFNPPVDLVAMLHLDIAQGMACDSALLVHQFDIVEDTLAELDTHELGRPGAVALPTDDDLIRDRRHYTPHRHDTYQDKVTEQPFAELHRTLLQCEVIEQCSSTSV